MFEWSFPTRERGLKLMGNCIYNSWRIVVPHAGTWIEMSFPHDSQEMIARRSPRGNVD